MTRSSHGSSFAAERNKGDRSSPKVELATEVERATEEERAIAVALAIAAEAG
jgi:DsbC/DsbD-like thiol-disulfide interchange protein